MPTVVLQRLCDSGKMHFAMKKLRLAETVWVAEKEQMLQLVLLSSIPTSRPHQLGMCLLLIRS